MVNYGGLWGKVWYYRREKGKIKRSRAINGIPRELKNVFG